VEAGRFLPGTKRLGLAVLHPRRIAVYSVTAMRGQSGGDITHFELSKSYEHKLARGAYNFCYGAFGGVAGKDFICVQSMDGEISILEQDSLSFTRYLNNFLVPGPLCYIAKTDSFVTANSSMEIECYKYQMLSASSAGKGASTGSSSAMPSIGENSSSISVKSNQHSKKKVMSDWALNLGEHVVDIFVAR